MSNALFPSAVRGLTYTVTKSQENSATLQQSPGLVSSAILRAQNPRWHWRLSYEVLFDDILRPNPSYTYTDFQTMLGFCQARYSNYDDFLFLDPDDNYVGPALITAAWIPNYPYMLGTIILAAGHAQQVAAAPGGARSGFNTPPWNLGGGTTTDGGLTWQDLGASAGYPNPQATLQVWSDGVTSYSPVQRNLGGQVWEDITDLVSNIVVYDNGVPTTSYTINSGGLAIGGNSCQWLYLTWLTPPAGPVTATFNFYFRVRLEESANDFEKFANLMWAIGGEQGSSGKGYLKLVSSPPQFLTVGVTPAVPPPGIPPPPGTGGGGGTGGGVGGGGTGGGGGGGTGGTIEDMLNWVMIGYPLRTTHHLKGPGVAAYNWKDADGIKWWLIKNGAGNPWDINTYDSFYIYHYITENADTTELGCSHW